MIAGYGLLAFRDPFGIRPLVHRQERSAGRHRVSGRVGIGGRRRRSASTLLRDVEPGEAIFVDLTGTAARAPVRGGAAARPVHLRVRVPRAARFGDRRHVGVPGAHEHGRGAGGEDRGDARRRSDIDVVIPIPDSSRSVRARARQPARAKPYREGFIKNRYIGRTFIMPGQAIRQKSVRQKLNPIGSEFEGKVVLLVDDSIVRGTTSREIVQMARDAGARKVYFASAAPPVRYPERLRHRHAEPARAGRHRPDRGRRSRARSTPIC